MRKQVSIEGIISFSPYDTIWFAASIPLQQRPSWQGYLNIRIRLKLSGPKPLFKRKTKARWIEAASKEELTKSDVSVKFATGYHHLKQ
jgi:hypothetical protein